MDFTEGRGTGVPKMRRALANNGSPEAVFYTDEARLTFWTEIRIHPEFMKDLELPGVHDGVYDGVHDRALSETQLKILTVLRNKSSNLPDILSELGYSSRSRNIRNALNLLIEEALIAYTIPEKPRSKNQQYMITQKGKEILAD